MKAISDLLPQNQLMIYSLSYPNGGEVFYIGQTVSPASRLRGHTKRLGFTPVMEAIEVVTKYTNYKGGIYSLGTKTEVYWIQQFEAWGFNLEQIRDKSNYFHNRKVTIQNNRKAA